MVEKIRELWQKHENSPIPQGFRSVIVEGLTATQIHCDMAANILTYINTGGHLGAHRVNALNKTKSALERSIEQIPDPSKAYFKNLAQISALVLKAVE